MAVFYIQVYGDRNSEGHKIAKLAKVVRAFNYEAFPQAADEGGHSRWIGTKRLEARDIREALSVALDIAPEAYDHRQPNKILKRKAVA